MIQVVNKYNMPKINFGDLVENVMFTNGSVLGNPFYKKARTDRKGSIEDYRYWLWSELGGGIFDEHSKAGQEIKR